MRDDEHWLAMEPRDGEARRRTARGGDVGSLRNIRIRDFSAE